MSDGPASDVTAIVLAGGRGTRISHIHPDTPKPMVPVLGRPFLFWLTAFLSRFGLADFVYSTGYRAEQIDAWCASDALPGLKRRTCAETSPLGTGGGVLNCLEGCRDWVLVVNGDGLCLSGIPELLAVRSMAAATGGLIGVSVPDAARYGSLSVDAEGDLTAFREKVPGQGLINCGIYLFRTEALRELGPARPLSMERNLIPGLIGNGARLRVVAVDDTPFIDIGTPETLAAAESFISTHLSGLG